MNFKNSLALGLTVGLSAVLITGCGSSNSFNPSAPNSIADEFLIIPNGGSSSLSVKRVNLATGATTHLGNTNVGTTPVMVKSHPAAPFIYVANGTDNTISVFSMLVNGDLTEVTGSPFDTSGGVRSLGIDPTGSFLYAAGSNQVSRFTIGQDGGLSGRTDTALPNGGAVTAPMAFYTNPNSQRILVIASGSGANAILNHFQVDANGNLSNGGSITSAGMSFDGLSTHPNGFLVASRETAAANDSQLVAFNISNQALPVEVGTVNLPFDCGGVVSGINGNIYVGSDSSNQLAGFTLNVNGVFSALNGSPYAIDHLSSFVVLDPTQTLLFAISNLPSNASAFGFGTDGSPLKSSVSPFAAGLTAPFLPDFVVFTN